MAVISVTQSQTIDAAGSIQDVYEITFTVAGRPGSFNVTVPKNDNAVAAAEAAISAEASQLYGL